MLTPEEYEIESIQMPHLAEKQSGINETSQLGVQLERKNAYDTKPNDM